MKNDCVTLFEYGFSILRSETLSEIGNVVKSIKIKNAENEDDTLDITVQETLKATFSSSDYVEAFSPKIVLNKNLKAPIESGDVVGTITYDIYNTTYSTNLIAKNSVNKKVGVVQVATDIFIVILKIILWCIGTVIGLFILLVLLRAYILTKRNQKKFRRRMYNTRFR